MKHQQIEASIAPFIPAGAATRVAELLFENNVLLKITNPRSTKLGDYRPHKNGLNHCISVNGDLEPQAFLVTLIHELGHLYCYRTYRRKVKPHGKEWKSYFSQLLRPFITENFFNETIRIALEEHIQNPKASSCVDEKLYKLLNRHPKNKNSNLVYISECNVNQTFEFRKREFVILKKLRKNYKCMRIEDKKMYIFSPFAEVKVIA